MCVCVVQILSLWEIEEEDRTFALIEKAKEQVAQVGQTKTEVKLEDLLSLFCCWCLCCFAVVPSRIVCSPCIGFAALSCAFSVLFTQSSIPMCMTAGCK